MKVKVNVGCSNRVDSVDVEKQKIRYALSRHVDYISEISLIPEYKIELLHFIQNQSCETTQFCTVPLYDSVLTDQKILEVMAEQYRYGVRAFTLHLTPRSLLLRALDQQFVINSRAGNFLHALAQKGLENPHFKDLHEILVFIKAHSCELFVGTSLRPGRVAESRNSDLWLAELFFVKNLLKQHGVGTGEYILECGGHIDATLLNAFVSAVSESKICVMGPLLTDATNSFDDLSSIIGTTILSTHKEIHTHLMLTRDEHVRLPTLESFKKGVDLSLVLKHNLNLSRGQTEAIRLEERFQNQSTQCTTGVNLFGPLEGDQKICTMCGRHCPLRNIKYPSASEAFQGAIL